MLHRKTLAALAALLVLTACGGRTDTTAAPHEGAASAATHLLDADLPDAIGVVAARALEPDQDVVVFGRVRYTADGVFSLVDDEVVSYCGQVPGTMDLCETPWDYCCHSPEKVTAATLVVEAKDADGHDVPKDALGIRPLDLVAVRARLERDDKGELFLAAHDGWYRRERPEVRPEIRFP